MWFGGGGAKLDCGGGGGGRNGLYDAITFVFQH